MVGRLKGPPGHATFGRMFLFLVAGIPVFGWLMSLWYFRGMFNPRTFLVSAGFGVLMAVPAMILHSQMAPSPVSPLEPLLLYALGSLTEFILPAALSLLGLILTARLRRQALAHDYSARSFSFLTGFFTYVAASGWFLGSGARDVYSLLAQPLLWMLLILVLAYLGEPLFSGRRASLILAALRIVAFCLLFGLVSLLFRENFELLAWMFAAALASFVLHGCRYGFPGLRDLFSLLRF
jgi:hypothetical protein